MGAANEQGWVRAEGTVNQPNFFCGVGTASNSEHRNWFVAGSPAPSVGKRSIIAANLQASGGTITGDVEYVVHQVDAPPNDFLRPVGLRVDLFNDLGDGTEFGSKFLTPANSQNVINFSLNAACVNYLNQNRGKRFIVGGRIRNGLAPDKYAFGGTGSNDGIGILITYAPNTPPVAVATYELGELHADGSRTIYLNGSGSNDADGDDLSYDWSSSFGIDGNGKGMRVTATLYPWMDPPHRFELIVSDTLDYVTTSGTIEVQDNEAPVISGVPDPVYVCTADSASQLVAVKLPGVHDNTDRNPVLTSDPNVSQGPIRFPVGETVVIFTATDRDGNVSTASTTVTVMKLKSLKLSAAHDVTLNATAPADQQLVLMDRLKTTNVMLADDLEIKLEVEVEPDTSAVRNRWKWRIDGDRASPNSGDFTGPQPVTSKLAPKQPLFNVSAWLETTEGDSCSLLMDLKIVHAKGDFSVDGGEKDVFRTLQPWQKTKYYYSEALPKAFSDVIIYVDRYIPGIKGNGTVKPLSVTNGVVSPTARLRVFAEASSPPAIKFNKTKYANGIAAPGYGDNVFEYTIDSADVKFPQERGLSGARPIPSQNILKIKDASLRGYELSFDAMSPYILIHGKGATNEFWRGKNAAGKKCWKGLADAFEKLDLPFDESISLSYFPPYDVSQASVVAQAFELGAKPASIAKEFGTQHINFICHSKGGLDTRQWLIGVKPLAGADIIVGQFLTIDTPHRGSVIADYAVDSAGLTVFELIQNTGVDVSAIALELAPAPLFKAIGYLLDVISPTKYPLLIIGPYVAKQQRKLGFSVDPQSPATIDLRPRNADLFNNKNFPGLALYNNSDSTKPSLLTIRADADLDGDGTISSSEKQSAIKFDTFAGMGANIAYYALRDVREVFTSNAGYGGSKLIIELPTNKPQPNDFLVTFNSAFPITFPGSPFNLAGTYKRDHGTITNDGIGYVLQADVLTVPKAK